MANSKAIPFMPQPENLDGSMAGDIGFDPLGLSSIDIDFSEVWDERLDVLCIVQHSTSLNPSADRRLFELARSRLGSPSSSRRFQLAPVCI